MPKNLEMTRVSRNRVREVIIERWLVTLGNLKDSVFTFVGCNHASSWTRLAEKGNRKLYLRDAHCSHPRGFQVVVIRRIAHPNKKCDETTWNCYEKKCFLAHAHSCIQRPGSATPRH